MKDKDKYYCKICGYRWPKKDANVSGCESHPYGLHVHCPRCGHVVAQFLKPSE